MIKKIVLIIVLGLVVWGFGAYTGFFNTSDSQELMVLDGIDENIEMSDVYDGEVEIASTTKQETSNTEIINNNEIEKKMKAILKTTKGDIEITFNNNTPKTVQNFVTLAEQDFYNGVKFHRVIKGFMIQGGDPLSKDEEMVDRWGTGGPGYQFEDEIQASNSNIVGSISMANAGPHTNGSQFFINTADNGFLNSKHTVFGNVTAGMDVVKSIESVDTFPNDRPIEHVEIISIEIVE